MRLKAVRIQNFRSIVDSGLVQIEDRVTVLVGKNEQGKTTFLRGLASFNPKSRYSPSDLPNHLRAVLEERPPADIPIIQLWLTPDTGERKALRGAVTEADQVQEFVITRFYDAHYSYKAKRNGGSEVEVQFTKPDISQHTETIQKSLGAFEARLTAHGSRLATFAPSVAQGITHIQQFVSGNFSDAATIGNLVATFTTALKALPGQDQAIQNDIAQTTKEIEAAQAGIQSLLATDPRVVLHRLIPSFVFHSTSLDRIPNEVNVADFVKDPEAASKGMANLCKVSGLSTQKIQELAGATETPKRETFEDHYNASISLGINEFWTQEVYHFHFRIEKEKLSVSISDGTYTRRISPSERSDGFQWYLSFYSALLSEVSPASPAVVLLDNPGLELHADGQRDIKRFLEEKLPATTQVLYVTHSPAMIDTFNLEQVRKVELRPDMTGTKVSRLSLGGESFDLLEPVRSAIGASLVTTLISNDFNVLVEGAADKPILEGAFAIFRAAEHARIAVNGSISETGKFLPRFYERAGLPYVVYLDADNAGRDLKRALLEAGIPEGKIIYLGDVIAKGEDFELEDIVDPALYYDAVGKTYSEDKLVPRPPDDPGKRTKRYEIAYKDAHNIGFSKRRVAVTLKSMLQEGGAQRPGLDDLRRLTDRLWENVQAQVRPAAAAARN
jgi:energy-coupling factor transporter ATP-binding protein EcfA2